MSFDSVEFGEWRVEFFAMLSRLRLNSTHS